MISSFNVLVNAVQNDPLIIFRIESEFEEINRNSQYAKMNKYNDLSIFGSRVPI